MSTVKLEVGAWYKCQKRFIQLAGLPGGDKDYPLDWIFYDPPQNHGDNTKHLMGEAYIELNLSGPHHIEPGDVVKPKPAGDKCWDVEMYGTQHLHRESIAHKVWNDGMGNPWVETDSDDNHRIGIPLSCLILVRKAEKAQPQPETDFQVGDEVEFLGFNYGDKKLWVDITIGRRYVLDYTHSGEVGFNDDRGQPRSRPSSEVKLIRRAGEKAETNKAAGGAKLSTAGADTPGDMPHVGASSGISAPPPAAPLNPRVLPSVSGSELVWPDVKCEKPKESECRLCSGGYNYWMNYMGDDSELFAQFQGLAMGFDCGPLNRCIPCIECHTEDYRQTIDNFTKFKRSLEPKKLTQLKGRL